MADEKKSYPKIPRNNWFLLRDKFKQRTPERVSPSYVATALGMSEASASANIIPPLRAFGLIGEDSKPTDLAYDWRDDSKYAGVCEKIFEKVYPQELRDIFHDPQNIDSKAIENWFARDAKVGQSAARAYTATFAMLLEADVSKAKEQKAPKLKNGGDKPKPIKSSTPKVAATPATKKAVHQDVPSTGETPGTGGKPVFSPKLHVDIQIHISPDSSPEQIDKIFESMAKHLPLKG
ncbi:hypothetical protein ASD78_05920 [Lysobacter sp. Root667]|uniref:DUF5343 domain-containing protein n=1 Tax=Lysobacter sp. Root667 TaxID=1736581 RepID=UPI0007000399|nr:DUF5343 domain-containing protein [Lysobacter sp. Root667]KRA77136.1 hypothetical protein ASD78_05920 [Lysobacter sp. Root667]